MRRRYAGSAGSDEDLNVTAFMNLMVVLVPFLLMMVVFSRVTILDLALPAGVSSGGKEPPMPLEIVVRADQLILADQAGGAVTEIPNTAEGYDLATLAEALRQLKSQAPERREATLLVEPEVDYERLVSVMDSVRARPEEQQDGNTVYAELFPEISLGDAPPGKRGK